MSLDQVCLEKAYPMKIYGLTSFSYVFLLKREFPISLFGGHPGCEVPHLQLIAPPCIKVPPQGKKIIYIYRERDKPTKAYQKPSFFKGL